MDLLLDTICNTFGGVLFIAILVILLLQTVRREHTAAESQKSSAGNTETLKASIERLRSLQESQQKTLFALAPSEVQQLYVELTESRNNRDAMLDEKLRLMQSIGDREVERDAARQKKVAGEQDVIDTRLRVDELTRELRAEREKRRSELKTTTAHAPFGKMEVQFVLQYGRLYQWQRYSPNGRPAGLNTEDFTVVENSDDGLVTVPRPNRGIAVRENLDEQQLLKRLKGLSSREHYLAIVVRPDSFKDFDKLRDVISTSGFEYRLIPADDSSVFHNTGGRRSLVQ